MNDDLRATLGTLAYEMIQLRGVTVDETQIEDCAIPFCCKSVAVARFLAEMADVLSEEYANQASGQVILLPGQHQYLLRIQAAGDVDVEDVLMSLVSFIDSAACDAPMMYESGRRSFQQPQQES